MKSFPEVLVVLGPTSSGKSEAAVEIAIKKNGEIISADSRQIYQGLDISSGKITEKEMKGVPHHLLGIIHPKKIFTAFDYALIARKKIKDILARDKLPIVCGGTGFYIDALLYDNFISPVPSSAVLRKKLNSLSDLKLCEKLQILDPEKFEIIDKQNRVRLIRALEITMLTGKPSLKREKKMLYNAKKVAILRAKEELDKRIGLRLDERLSSGMIEEIKNIKYPSRGKGLTWKRLYELGLECRYISLYLRKKISYEDMRFNLLKEIKKYAKRQMTWFKKDKDIEWISADDVLKFCCDLF